MTNRLDPAIARMHYRLAHYYGAAWTRYTTEQAAAADWNAAAAEASAAMEQAGIYAPAPSTDATIVNLRWSAGRMLLVVVVLEDNRDVVIQDAIPPEGGLLASRAFIDARLCDLRHLGTWWRAKMVALANDCCESEWETALAWLEAGARNATLRVGADWIIPDDPRHAEAVEAFRERVAPTIPRRTKR